MVSDLRTLECRPSPTVSRGISQYFSVLFCLIVAFDGASSESNLEKARETAIVVGVEQCCSGLSQACKETLFTSILTQQAAKFGAQRK